MERRFAQVIEAAQCRPKAEGYPIIASFGLGGKAQAELQLGQLAEAEADQTAVLEVSQQLLPSFVPLMNARLAEILFERGQYDSAYKTIEGISLASIGGGWEAGVRQIRGRLRFARGWRQRAVDDLRAAGRLCELHGLRNPIMYPWRALLVAALAQDDIAEARQLAQENLANARRSGIPRSIGIALHTLAGLEDDKSVQLLRDAVAVLKVAPAPLDLARALTDLGTALRRQGFRLEARDPLREALEIAARCGAVPLMERAQAEAMVAGARPRRPRLRGSRRSPRASFASPASPPKVAPTERSTGIIHYRQDGDRSLGSSYGKLGITSREQLAVALERSGPGPDG